MSWKPAWLRRNSRSAEKATQDAVVTEAEIKQRERAAEKLEELQVRARLLQRQAEIARGRPHAPD